MLSGEVLAQCFERRSDPCTPSDFPLEPVADFGRFKMFNQGTAADGGGVANLKAGKSGHQLARSALPDTKYSLHCLPVQIIGFQRPQFR